MELLPLKNNNLRTSSKMFVSTEAKMIVIVIVLRLVSDTLGYQKAK